MSWQARLEIYKKGFLDEVDAILGDQEDKEYRLQLAREIDALAAQIVSETYDRRVACHRDLLGLPPMKKSRR